MIPELFDTRLPDVHVDVAVLLPKPLPEPPRVDGISGDRFGGTEFTGGITIVDAVDIEGGNEFTAFEFIVMFIPKYLKKNRHHCIRLHSYVVLHVYGTQASAENVQSLAQESLSCAHQ